MKYVLTTAQRPDSVLKSKAKTFSHLECGEKLEPIKDGTGRYSCVRCLKAGYLLTANG